MTIQEIDEISDILEIKNAYEYGLNMTNSIMDKINKDYRKSALFKFITIQIDFTMFFLKSQEEIDLYFNNKTTKNLEKKDVNMIDYIINMINKTKRIFMNVDIYGYGHTDGEEHKYDTHSVMVILIPVENNYKAIIINPHGRDITYNYEVVYSSRRVKKVYYKDGLDANFMNLFVGYLNQNLKKRSQTKVLFENTNKYIYNGVNLQSGDSRGYCYLFPFVMFHYFRYYYNDLRILNTVEKYRDSYTLLKNGDLDEFIASCLIDYCKPYKEKIIEIGGASNIKNYYEDFENIIYKQDYRLFKNMAAVHLFRCEKIFWDLEMNKC